MKNLTRRKFLQRSLALTAISLNPFFSGRLQAAEIIPNQTKSKFVFLFLAGGIDALSVLIPTTPSRSYLQHRKHLKFTESASLANIAELELNALMPNLHTIFHLGGVELYLGTSTGSQSLSHFEQTDFLGYGKLSNSKTDSIYSRLLSEIKWPKDKLAAFDVSYTNSPGMQFDFLSTLGEDLFDMNGNALRLIENIFGPNEIAYYPDSCKNIEINEAFRKMCLTAQALRQNSAEIKTVQNEPTLPPRTKNSSHIYKNARSLAKFLRSETTVPIAVSYDEGWDTHKDQKKFLTKKLVDLDAAIGDLYFNGILKAPGFNTSVVIGSEFGRTLTSNSGAGTEHGHGGLTILLSKPRNLASKKLFMKDLSASTSQEYMPIQYSIFDVFKKAMKISFELNDSQINSIFS